MHTVHISLQEKARVAVLGASGYTGAEVVRLSALHPNIRITALTGEKQAGKVGLAHMHILLECLLVWHPHLEGPVLQRGQQVTSWRVTQEMESVLDGPCSMRSLRRTTMPTV